MTTPWLSVALGAIGLLLSANVVSGQAGFRQPASPGYASRDACPERCSVSGPNPSNWSAYHNFDQFQSCQQTLFYDFNLHDKVDDANTFHRIHTCTSYGPDWTNLPNSTTNVATIESVKTPLIRLGGGPKAYLANGYGPTNKAVLLFAQSGQAAAGLYIGQGLQNEGLSSFALKTLEDNMPSLNLDTSSMAINGTFAPVQDALKSWANAECLSFLGSMNFTGPVHFTTPLVTATNGTNSTVGGTNSTSIAGSKGTRLSARGDCRTIQVQSGDGCAALAQSCGISGADFAKYNPGSSFCSSLKLLQHVCCSSGTLPDFRPKPNSDGSCHTYKIQSGDSCSSVAAANSLSIDDLDEFNKKTWGWNGCSNLCTGAPGTAKPGTNGCISNCGTAIVRGDAPPVFRRLGYFEGYSFTSRDCLYQDALLIGPEQYTHLHFAFGTITPDYRVHTGDVATTYEFENFKRIRGPNRILSFGGWDFSTSPSTYTIFRQGVTPANRLTLATNIADFIKDNGLDGVDIDWEYPSAPDIPNIPAGSADEGTNYLAFLAILKNLLPGKSVSIAAPASYWYLKGFPIKQISEVVDYIVFMTYDLHGQWDAQNQNSQIGCPSGMCLRSGVNLTETINSLVMITKAGVPSNQLVVGVTSYGRSFAMAEADCHTPNCFYTGTPLHSNAEKGPCTGTAGYIANAEIQAILKNSSRVNEHYVDRTSNSNILVYDDLQWVGYMSPEVRDSRTALYKSLNMGGTTNWAIDLESYNDPPARSHSWSDFAVSLKTGLDPYQVGERSGNWTSLTCTDRSVEGIRHLSPSERWNMMDCPDAWKDVIDVWKTYDRPDNLTFIRSISATLHGPELAGCGDLLPTNYCVQTIQCSPFIGSGSGPAAYEIWNSLVMVHEMYQSYHEALIAAAATSIDNALKDFENKFAPVPEPPDDKWAVLLIDLITLGATMVAGPFFNSFLARLPYFIANEAALANLKDTSVTVIGQSTTIAKDLLNVNTLLFDGSDNSFDTLTSIISDGKLIEGSGHKPPRDRNKAYSEADLEASVGKAFFAFAIPAIWSVSGTFPFIIDSGYECGKVDPLTEYLFKDTMHKTFGCVDGKLYYLATPEGDAQHCSKSCLECGQTCDANSFSAPPGIDSLDGKSFGGVTVADLIKGSVRTYIANGNKNGGKVPDPTDKSTFDNLFNQDVGVHGTNTSVDNYPCVVPKGKNDYGALTLVDQTSDASPQVSDCLQIIKNIQGTDGEWEVENAVGKQHQIVQFGSCKFGVQGNGKNGNIDFNVGAQDIIDIINDSVKQFGGSGKVGANGEMSCSGTVKGQQVEWGLY
uniref:chitinase n=1 Tax=Tolypocladium ophioglossoides (strain CBS 100239) TaxID=1163406 RepID=A0A0L0NAP9_TOLOC